MSGHFGEVDMLDRIQLGGGSFAPMPNVLCGSQKNLKKSGIESLWCARSKAAHFSFWLDPYMVHFYSANQKSCFLGGFTNRGSQAAEWANMDDFGIFLKNRPTGANKSSKIVFRVLFWYPGIYATQKHLRSSISGTIFKAKNRQFWGILGQIPAPPKIGMKTPFYL